MDASVKKVDIEKLIEIKGKKFLDEHKGDFAISYSEVYDEYIITFLLSESTGNVNQNKLVNKVSYSVIKDGYPVYFAVVECPDSEEPVTMDEMSALAEMTAKTFRNHPDYE